MSAPPPNAASRWFAAAEALGDFMGILYGRLSEETGEVDWHHVSHVECDGIGGFARLLEQHGAPQVDMPCASVPSRGLLGPLWRYWRHQRAAAPCAGRRDWPSPAHADHQTPGDRAWHLFSEADTAAILECCRREAVSVNSLLLHHLDRVVRPELKLSDRRIPWMIPVNLRDANTAHSTANQVSSVRAIIAPSDSTQSVHRQLRERLERGEHRAGALLMGLARFFSPQRCQRILARDRAKNEGSIGAFSNLGSWDAEGALPTRDSWLFCPPIGGGQRLASGCVTFQGRLGLVIQTHVNDARESSLADAWMERWAEGVMSMFAGGD